MLKYFRENFEVKSEYWSNINDPLRLDCFTAYKNKLIQEGYIFRNTGIQYQDSNNHTIILNGIMGNQQAIKDAESSSEISTVLSEIEKHIKTKHLETFDCCDEDSYCEHSDWDSIIIMNNDGYMLGEPSLVCGSCGGLIAPYRLRLSYDLLSDLRFWELQYDAIDELSTLCSDYEDWSDRELYDINSKINKIGIRIASEISVEMKCEVNYRFREMENDFSNCPKCNKPLVVKGKKERKYCVGCHILVA